MDTHYGHGVATESVRLWHCGGRASSETWREPSLGVLASLSHKRCITLKRWVPLGQDKEHESKYEKYSRRLVCWLVGCELGGRICLQPRERSDLRLHALYWIVLLTNSQQCSLRAPRERFGYRRSRMAYQETCVGNSQLPSILTAILISSSIRMNMNWYTRT